MTPKVQDQGHRYADKKLAALTKRLQRSYRQARLNLLEKIGAYLEQFEKEDAMMRAFYDSGELSHQDYMTWRYRKIAGTKQWRDMLDQLTTDLVNADKIAASMIRNELPEVYSENHNYGTYEIERDLQMSTSYTLYNRDAVARLLKENPKLLPNQPNVNVPKDKRWNWQHLQSAVLQGILTGEPMKKIADRFENVVGMDERAAIRNARTAVTGAENAGKLDSMMRAIGLGVQLKKMWLATRDQRTRDSHAMMDGELRDIDEPFSNGCMYPGDPEGAPAEVYNCRCAMRSKVAGADPYSPDLSRNHRLGEMSYEEWKQQAGERFYERLFKNEKVELKNSSTQDNEVNMASQKHNNEQSNIKNDNEENKLFDRTAIQYSPAGLMLKDCLDHAGVEYKEVQIHETQLTEIQIIQRLAGGDETKGSCVSVALAYIGNKHGLDVLDFRGGESLKQFSNNALGLTRLNGIIAKSDMRGSIKTVKKQLSLIEKGKEYLLQAGSHMTIVRIDDTGKPQYLELQSEGAFSGWKPFEYDHVFAKGTPHERHIRKTISDTLIERFGYYDEKDVRRSYLIDIDLFKDSDEFRDLLGYINTEEGAQQKGKNGYAK